MLKSPGSSLEDGTRKLIRLGGVASLSASSNIAVVDVTGASECGVSCGDSELRQVSYSYKSSEKSPETVDAACRPRGS